MAGINKVCKSCGRPFTTTEADLRKGGGKYCSCECYHISRRGKRSSNWKGGRKVNIHGYVEIYKPEHQNADVSGYVKEHVFVMSEKIGRAILKGEVVHHKNEIRDDNRIENLRLMPRGDHARLHNKGAIFSFEHCARISAAKKKISKLIVRDESGRFKGGVSYGRC